MSRFPAWNAELEEELRIAYHNSKPSEDSPSKHTGLKAVYDAIRRRALAITVGELIMKLQTMDPDLDVITDEGTAVLGAEVEDIGRGGVDICSLETGF